MYKGFKYIDADAHVIEPSDLWEKYLEKKYADEMPVHLSGYRHVKIPEGWRPGQGRVRYVPGTDKDPLAFVDDVRVAGYVMPEFLAGRCAPQPQLGELYGAYAEAGFDSKCYQDYLKRSGADYMALFPTAALYALGAPTLQPGTAAAYCRAYNNWLHDFCTAIGPQALGVALLDMRDPEEAAREARRCAQFGFRAVTILPQPVNQYPFFAEVFDIVWGTMQELDVPVMFHPAPGTHLAEVGHTVLSGWTGRGVAGFVLESMMVNAEFINGGILTRFPQLRMGHVEIGCGWVPYWVDRLKAGIQGAERRSGDRNASPLTPAQLFARQCFVAADPDDPHVASVVAAVGEDCIVPASDFGHPEGRFHMAAIEDTLNLPIGDTLKRKLMWDNPARLYGIKA